MTPLFLSLRNSGLTLRPFLRVFLFFRSSLFLSVYIVFLLLFLSFPFFVFSLFYSVIVVVCSFSYSLDFVFLFAYHLCLCFVSLHIISVFSLHLSVSLCVSIVSFVPYHVSSMSRMICSASSVGGTNYGDFHGLFQKQLFGVSRLTWRSLVSHASLWCLFDVPVQKELESVAVPQLWWPDALAASKQLFGVS